MGWAFEQKQAGLLPAPHVGKPSDLLSTALGCQKLREDNLEQNELDRMTLKGLWGFGALGLCLVSCSSTQQARVQGLLFVKDSQGCREEAGRNVELHTTVATPKSSRPNPNASIIENYLAKPLFGGSHCVRYRRLR